LDCGFKWMCLVVFIFLSGHLGLCFRDSVAGMGGRLALPPVSVYVLASVTSPWPVAPLPPRFPNAVGSAVSGGADRTGANPET